MSLQYHASVTDVLESKEMIRFQDSLLFSIQEMLQAITPVTEKE